MSVGAEMRQRQRLQLAGLTAESYSINFLQPVTRGRLRATGSVVYRSPRMTVAESKAFDYKDRLVATGSGTFMSSTLRLDERVGYK
jgi:uncharacterized protein (TIGR00369 family)